MNNPISAKPNEPTWNLLYRIGGIAPLLTLAFYISEFLFIRWDSFPTSTEGWFSLFQRNKLLGLFYLNALDIFSIALLGVMFLALYVALRKINQSLMAIAGFFSLLGFHRTTRRHAFHAPAQRPLRSSDNRRRTNASPCRRGDTEFLGHSHASNCGIPVYVDWGCAHFNCHVTGQCLWQNAPLVWDSGKRSDICRSYQRNPSSCLSDPIHDCQWVVLDTMVGHDQCGAVSSGS